ncbi:MAG: formate dehydrogenase accessory protein FdhE [Desulfobacteraceae bacterium]|nr:formate dehydrogenase accessory protein FdhE [Desulfobacteraceae bacterium]
MTGKEIAKENDSILEQIKKAANFLEKEKPFIKEVVRFYEKVFSLQHEFDSDITKDYSVLKSKKDFPLISKKDFDIDFYNAEILFEKICDLCQGSEIQADVTAKIIKESIIDKELSFKSIVQSYLEGNISLPEAILGNSEFNPQVFDFILYNSLKPSIVKSSKIISSYFKEMDQTEQGRCPVCGSAPALSLFSKENGSRSLVCNFCWHEWETKRIVCPFCNNNDSKTLGYVALDNEKGIRADYCDKCKKYIKTIDLREYREDIYLPLELIASIPFDMKMNEEGFKSE